MKQSPEREESLLVMLRKLVSVVPENWIEDVMPVELSDDQRRILLDSLRNLKAVIVGARITQSILLYTYSLTLDVMESVWLLYESGQLTEVLQGLCRCLANDDGCTIDISIDPEDYEKCREEYSSELHLILSKE